MAPVVIMGTKFTDFILHELENKICSTPPEEFRRILKASACPKKFGNGVWSFTVSAVGAVSAGPLTYLNHIFWYPRIGMLSLVFDIPTFYVKMIADIWAMRNLASESYYTLRTYFYPKVLRDRFGGVDSTNRAYVNRLIDNAYKVISELGSESQRVVDLLEATNVSAGDTLQDVYTKLHNLLYPNKCLDAFGEAIVVHDTPKIRRLMQLIGGVLGAFSMAAVEPLAEQGVRDSLSAISSFNSTNASSQDNTGVEAISWLATVSAGSLMSFATADSFGKLYDFLAALPQMASRVFQGNETNLDRLNEVAVVNTPRERVKNILSSRGSIAAISMLFAIASAIPNAELSYKYLGTETAYDRFALTSAIVSPLATYFWAIDEFFLGLKGLSDRRLPLYFKLHLFKEIVNEASQEHIHSFVKSLQDEHFNLEAEV